MQVLIHHPNNSPRCAATAGLWQLRAVILDACVCLPSTGAFIRHLRGVFGAILFLLPPVYDTEGSVFIDNAMFLS